MKDIVQFSSFSQWEMESRNKPVYLTQHQGQKNKGARVRGSIGIFPTVSHLASSLYPCPTSPCSTFPSPSHVWQSRQEMGSVHMVSFQFMWELTSSLPVSGYVLKGSTEPSYNPDSPTHQSTHLPLQWMEVRKSQLQQLCRCFSFLYSCAEIGKLPFCKGTLILSEQSLCIIPFQFLPYLREQMNLEKEGVEICGNFFQQKLKQNGRPIKLREKKNGKFTVAI